MSHETVVPITEPRPDYSVGRSVGKQFTSLPEDNIDEEFRNRYRLMGNRNIFNDRLNSHFAGLRLFNMENPSRQRSLSVETDTNVSDTSSVAFAYEEDYSGKVQM